jgi:mannitol-1-phosphate 5-dehydrogenase
MAPPAPGQLRRAGTALPLARARPGHDGAMPTLVQFGAGNIGRGFIAPTFTGAGWTVVFVEVDPARVAALNRRGAYRVIEVDGASEQAVEVRPVHAISAHDGARVAEALSACDLAATAVGLAALPLTAPALAAGLILRAAHGMRALEVLVCENGAQAHATLHAAVLAELAGAGRAALGERLAVVRTAIGRMIPAATGGDELDIRVEPYRCLPVERAAFRGPPPVVPNLVPRGDFELVLQEKLYLHNLTHACLAYGGHLRGLSTIPDCVADARLARLVRAAGDEAGEALARRHGTGAGAQAAIREECKAMLDGLMARYGNRALNDPVARVARDPWRKLASDDRLVGAARLCLETGVAPTAILEHILAASRYTPGGDEPRAAEWLALQGRGPGALLEAVSGLRPGDPLLAAILTLAHARPAPG